ncbi:MAG: IMCp domain-containing protein [Bacilli bacterium]|jgi:hypothetical protein
MNQSDFARKFTDIEYLSKKEISARLGVGTGESVWKLVDDYRERYRFALDLKKFDRLPFSIVLTPSIMALSNTAERLMFQYAMLFENHRIFQSFADDKTLEKYRNELSAEDLLVMARTIDLSLDDRDIRNLLSDDNNQFKDTVLYGFYQCRRELGTDNHYKINNEFIRYIWSRLNRTSFDPSLSFYRMNEVKSKNGFEEFIGAPVNRISEYINMLVEFVESEYELSPFINAAIAYSFFIYTLPFERYSEYAAILIYEKMLADSGYGECAHYLSLAQFLTQRDDDLQKAMYETRKTGDLTYMIVFLNQLVAGAIQWRMKTLYKVGLPHPNENNIQVIEKIVEVPVEKIVEVPVEKEVIKEIEVIKEVEVIREVPVEKIVYRDVQPAKSDDSSAPNRVETSQEDQKIITAPKGFHFMQDPFARATSLMPQPKESSSNESQILPTRPSPVILEEQTLITDVQLDALNDLDSDEYAKHLMELNPLIRDHQARFYATHRTKGRYYTIGQFKEFANCAYETARTSMDFLTTLGLYRKEQLKNKFVYTPTSQHEGDQE